MSESTNVSAADAIDALNNLDDYARMADIAPKGDVQILLKFILQKFQAFGTDRVRDCSAPSVLQR